MTNILFARKLTSWGQKATALAIAIMVIAAGFSVPAKAQDAARKKAIQAAMKKSMAEALAYAPWIKNCQKAPKSKTEICGTHADYFDSLRGGPYTRVAIQKVGSKEPTVLINMINGWLVPIRRKDPKTKKVVASLVKKGARWIIPAGVFIKIDDNKVHKFRFQFCTSVSCVAQGKASKALMNEMMKGKKMVVVGLDGGRNHPEIVSLKGFGKAYKGKASKEPYNPTMLAELKKMVAKQKAFLKKKKAAAKKK